MKGGMRGGVRGVGCADGVRGVVRGDGPRRGSSGVGRMGGIGSRLSLHAFLLRVDGTLARLRRAEGRQ